MANVAKLKAKLVMETEEYMKSADKVVSRTTAMGNQIDKITNKVAKSYANAITSSVMGLVSAQAIDGALRGLSKALDEFDPKGMRNFDSMLSGIGDKIGDLIKQVPLIGAFVELGNSIYYSGYNAIYGERAKNDPRLELEQKRAIEERRKFTDSQKPAVEMIKDLEYQARLSAAVTEEERKRLQMEHEREQIMQKLNGVAEGPQKERMRQELEAAVKKMQAERELAEQRKKAEAEQKKAAEARQKEEEKLAKSREDFMRDMEERVKNQTMTDRQRFEEKMAELKIEGADRERMEALYGQLKQAPGGDHGSTTGVSSAVGSLRMAGAVDYSQQRMATSLDAIKVASQKTSDFTQRLLEAQRTC